MFSWLAFVQRHRLDYRESGAHTKRGNVYVWCPWCRDPDPDKKRMGLHLDSPRFGCWKNEIHRGKDPVRLIRALIGCSWSQAVTEAEEGGARSAVADLRARLDAIGHTEPTTFLDGLPAEFERFDGATQAPLSWFRTYVQSRGFPGTHADRVARRYALRAADGGRYDRRVIVPFHDLKGRLVGWSGRHISKGASMRYLTEGQTRDVLYNGNRVIREGGRLLVVTEGPFDAMKVDYYGAEYGIRAVAAAGLGNVGNVGLLTVVFDRGGFDHLLTLLDYNATAQSMSLRRSLLHLPSKRGHLPPGVKDPGDLTPNQVPALLDQVL